jgi:hypothetical protein
VAGEGKKTGEGTLALGAKGVTNSKKFWRAAMVGRWLGNGPPPFVVSS